MRLMICAMLCAVLLPVAAVAQDAAVPAAIETSAGINTQMHDPAAPDAVDAVVADEEVDKITERLRRALMAEPYTIERECDDSGCSLNVSLQ